MPYIVPQGRTREFTFKIKLDDNSLVNPDSIDFVLSNKEFTFITAGSYRCFITAKKDAEINSETHLLAKAKYTHSNVTYKFNLDVLLIVGAPIANAPDSDEPIRLDIIGGEYVPRG